MPYKPDTGQKHLRTKCEELRRGKENLLLRCYRSVMVIVFGGETWDECVSGQSLRLETSWLSSDFCVRRSTAGLGNGLRVVLVHA